VRVHFSLQALGQSTVGSNLLIAAKPRQVSQAQVAQGGIGKQKEGEKHKGGKGVKEKELHKHAVV
jgi:hypothetical protein